MLVVVAHNGVEAFSCDSFPEYTDKVEPFLPNPRPECVCVGGEGGGGVLPYISYMGECYYKGYDLATSSVRERV